MSREIPRVPLDFNWPLNEPWAGYIMPDRLYGETCSACKSGYSPEAQYFQDQWYGNRPFDPTSTGSTPFLASGDEAQAWALRQVKNNPEYYGSGESARNREARRIVRFWNDSWSHHLSQEDVDALIADDRLRELTHDFVKGTGWVPKPEPLTITAAEVNVWSLTGFGHDSINAWICVKARAEREGVRVECSNCDGTGSVEAYPGQKAEADAWKPIPAPEGSGWQLWETVSEGSPTTPVFETAEELAAHIHANQSAHFYGMAERSLEDLITWVTDDGWSPSLAMSI